MHPQVYPNGSLEFVSNSGSSPRTCCGPKLTSWDGGEVIGAAVSEQGSSPSVHVYYCPEQVKGGKTVRHLKKAGPFYSENVQQAKQLAAEVRNANSRHGDLQIGGKTVLAVVRFTCEYSSHLEHTEHPSCTCCAETVDNLRVSPQCLCR